MSNTFIRTGSAGGALLAALLLASLVAPAHAAKTGTKLSVKSRTNGAGQTVSVVKLKGSDPDFAYGTATDADRLSVEVSMLDAGGESIVFLRIPPGSAEDTGGAGWTVSAKRAKYKNGNAPDGATGVKVAIFKPGRGYKIVAKALTDATEPDDTDPDLGALLMAGFQRTQGSPSRLGATPSTLYLDVLNSTTKFSFSTPISGCASLDNCALQEGPLADSLAPCTFEPQVSTFDVDIDGWTVTGGPADPPQHVGAGGETGGYLSVQSAGALATYVVAPSKFLGDWSSLDGVGELFFKHRIEDAGPTIRKILDFEIRIASASAGASATWVGKHPDSGPAPKDPAPTWPHRDWVTVRALVAANNWTVNPPGAWESLLEDVTSLEIKIEMVGNQGVDDRNAIDTVVLRCPDSVSEAICGVPNRSSTFDLDTEGWIESGIGSANGTLSQVASGGYPGGYLQWQDSGDGAVFVDAPPSFLGSWSDLDGIGKLSFDQKVFLIGSTDKRLRFEHLTVDLGGPGGSSATWDIVHPDAATKEVTEWRHFAIPLDPSQWKLGKKGTWSTLLSDIQSLRVRIEGIAFSGVDITGLDNLFVGVSDCVDDATETCDGTGADPNDSWEVFPEPSAGPDERMDRLLVDGPYIYAVGDFLEVDGATVNHIGRFDSTTDTWSPLGTGLSGWAAGGRDLHQIGTDIYVGATFTSADGVAASHIAKYDTVTETFSALGSGSSSSVWSLASIGTDLYVGTNGTTHGGVPSNRIAKYDTLTGTWSALGSGLGGPVAPIPWALATIGTDLYAVGDFETAGGNPALRIAKWDSLTAQWSALGSGLNERGREIVAVGTDLYVAGFFTMAGGVPASHVAKYDTLTGTWSALGDGVDGLVGYALAAKGDDVYLGGDFTTAGGAAANNIAKWNETTGTWSALGAGTDGPGSNGIVYRLRFAGDDLYAAGFFTSAGGKETSRFARWTTCPSPTPAARFVDNGDGTITDNQQGLMWAKKSDDGTVHDKDNGYPWTTSGSGPDGPLYTTYLASLNSGGGFAGHTDWRIPEVNQDGGNEEIDSLIDLTETGQFIFSEFKTPCTPGCTVNDCSCQSTVGYWSSTTSTANSGEAWAVGFSLPVTSVNGKAVAFSARAVRTLP